jgi:Zn-finger protein
MKLRKFKVLSVVLNPGGPGPERLWECTCSFIKDKQQVERVLMSIGRTADEAKRKLEQRFGGRN